MRQAHSPLYKCEKPGIYPSLCREKSMSFENWAAFAAASTVLLVIPGPTVLLVVSYALGQGWRTAVPMAIGVALGDFTAMTLSMLGIGALLAASATVFTVLKTIGAAYLIYLGVKLFRAGGTLAAEPRSDATPPLKMMAHAWLVTALNPKSITFFVAFLPQFLDRHADFLTQMLIFESTFLVLAFANAFGYALVATRARKVVRNASAIRMFNRAGGTLLVGAGVATMATRNG
jgi:threonine/homoserine/homoserine lactone efflux protein